MDPEVRREAAAGLEQPWHSTVISESGATPDSDTVESTQASQAVEDLGRPGDHLATVLEGVADGIILQDGAGRLIFANQAAARIFGYTRAAQLLDAGADQFFHDLTIMDEFGNPFPPKRFPGRLVFRGLPNPQCTLRFQTGTGEERWAVVKAAAIRDGRGEIEFAINTISDITGCKRAEEEHAEVLRRVDRLKSELIANVSHELRTPLHHIRGYAFTLLRPDIRLDAETAREHLQIIVEECDKLARVIGDLVNSSQIENGTLLLEIDTVALDEIARGAIRRWQGIDSHQFALALPDEVPPVAADGRRIQQVLDNLLANVVCYTPEHTLATISLQVTRNEVVVSVSDSGPGIGAEHIPFLFNHFYQAGEHPYQRHGTGLGLYICKGIVEQHGGRIWVEINSQSGTTFRFSLPRRHQARRNRARRTPSRPGSRLPSQSSHQ